MLKKVLLCAAVLAATTTTSSFGAGVKVYATLPSDVLYNHVQVWLSGGSAFIPASYASTPTDYALGASSAYTSWGVGPNRWQNWIGDVKVNGFSNKVAVIETTGNPTYITSYRINFAALPNPVTTPAQVVYTQFYNGTTLVQTWKHTRKDKLNGTPDIYNYTNDTWELIVNPTGFSAPGYVSKTGVVSSVPEPGSIIAALSILAPAGMLFRRRTVA